MADRNNILGAVLAGGRSSRFGTDKSEALWKGRSLLRHAIASLETECDEVVLCAGNDRAPEPGIVTLPDRPEPGLGPLGGLCAALSHALHHGFDAVLSAPVDVHPIPEGLADLLGNPGPAVLADHWLLGLWPAALAPQLEKHLRAGHRSVRSWIEACGARRVDFFGQPPVNLNSPDMLAALEDGQTLGEGAEIHALRGHAGQIEAAAAMRALLDSSEIRESHREDDLRVQDPYCLRCAPQVIGACLDQLAHAGEVLRIEANAATDNPLVLSDGSIVSGGNFHAEPVGMAADGIAIAVSEIGAIAQRRIALLVDPALSFGLPAFLAPSPGLQSGLMIAEVTSAALMSENKALANPRVVDSTPTSANQEDHVSMACHGARRLIEMNGNLAAIVGIEAMTAAQGVEFRAPLATSDTLGAVIARIRDASPTLTEDRLMEPDIAAMAQLLGTRLLTEGVACSLIGDFAG